VNVSPLHAKNPIREGRLVWSSCYQNTTFKDTVDVLGGGRSPTIPIITHNSFILKKLLKGIITLYRITIQTPLNKWGLIPIGCRIVKIFFISLVYYFDTKKDNQRRRNYGIRQGIY
jgi:hypothetical protein